MGRKKALLVGCNYPGTKAELHGCVNDVKRMYRCLVEKFGFDEEEMIVLIDTDSDGRQPTGANIRHAMAQLVDGSEEGDVLFFHYSGHGVRVPAESGEPDDTGYDECIVPCDMNLITDDDFRELVDKIPPSCKFTVVSDSCHSGGLIENTKEQVGDSTTRSSQEEKEESGSVRGLILDTIESRGIHLPFHRHRHRREEEEEEEEDGLGYEKNKSISLQTFIELLKEKTGREDVTVGNIRPTLFDVFGDDASPKVKKFVSVVMQRLNDGKSEGFWGTVGGIAQDFLKTKIDEGANIPSHEGEYSSAYAGWQKKKSGSGDVGILVSGCQSDETSADANPKGNKEEAYGALSNAVQSVLEGSSKSISNKDLVIGVRELLSKQGFKQRPGLYCSDENVNSPFISHFYS